MKRVKRVQRQSKPNKTTKTLNHESDDDDAQSAIEEEENLVEGNEEATRFLAVTATPDSKGNIQIGAASLDCVTGSIFYLGRTIGWQGEFGFLTGLILELTQPIHSILLSSKLDEALVEAIQNSVEEVKLSQVQTFPSAGTVMLPSAFFDFQQACKLIGTRFGMATNALGSVVDLSNQASVSCVGAVLCHAQRIFPQLPPVEFDMFDLGQYLIMDGGSMKALDLVRSEEHPSVIRGRGRAKEGFTLLTLLDRSKSPLGSRTLRRWVVRPLTQAPDIEDRYDSVEFIKMKIGQESLVNIVKFLGQIGDLPKSLLRLKTCSAKVHDWMILTESLTNIVQCLQELQALKVQGFIFPVLLQRILASQESPGLFEVSRALHLVDWEVAQSTNRIVPVEGVSEEVDEARRRLLGLPDFLAGETAAVGICGFTIRCIPVIGFVAALEESCLHLVSTADFDFLFEARKQQEADEQDGALVRYFKTERTRFLDKELGDIIGLCRDAEDAVVRRIEENILLHEGDLLLASHRCAELDALYCFAEVAHDFSYVRPHLTNDPIVRISQARHPLLERVLNDQFVPSDIQINFQRILVVTGPNWSGKSVILKTVALISILAQIGCFVPADEATLGIVDRIFTRMSGLESVASAPFQRESSFSIDVQQVVSMIRSCTPNSLLCIDEFGKGTNNLDGCALLAAVIEHLGTAFPTPRVLIATHLVEMFDAKLLNEQKIDFGEMRVEFNEDGGGPVPLFRLALGGSINDERESYGIACARRVGVFETVLERAHEFTLKLKHNQLLFGCHERQEQKQKLKMEHAITTFLTYDAKWSHDDVDKFFAGLEL